MQFMKTRLSSTSPAESAAYRSPDGDELAALRALYAGMPVRQAAEPYLPARLGAGRSDHGILGAIRRRLARVARTAGRPDLVSVLTWKAVPRLGPAGARRIEVFFEAHPALTERARALVATSVPPGPIVPWAQLWLLHEVDGSSETFRAPRETCTLDADNDYTAVQA
ncbi:hypothetical protein LMG29542_08319 [Paraburkholderia humisilvae]|uniref:Uncharacterized protein n=1 Tax=Paraburkholderia humisilvae TaxID=627669 RepID=A0A6J5FBU5_9BURK|nr:hypothetical protein LMG29542_08319 [Paraburkholderia humisilvae]